ncbi:OmpA family protein [Dentiradicibacter hellwigii]|uniref:OmpA family protein n=1 Tax=Dentiradicibacter hellwigii TaxID=3149053 RepID=A0ABV4UCV1_9RHOO
MKTLRFLTCVAALSALCACGQEPEPAKPQNQASAASTTVIPQTQPNASAPVPEQAPAAAPAESVSSTLSAQGNNLSTQGSSLSAQGSSLSGTETGFNIQINLSSDVLFDFDKSELKPEADAELQKAADVIRQKGKGLILIIGYTDSKGSDAYNQRLSLARAQAVKNWFEAKGLNQNYQVKGQGATNPVAPNTHPDGSDNPEGRAKNRRVEIIVNKTTQLGG